MSHKRLSQYSVIAGGKLSKVIEFSKGEAEIYVKNFIETHLSHAVLKASGGLMDVKGYFSDTKQIKEKIEEQIKTITSAIGTRIKSLEDRINGISPDGENVMPLIGEAKEKAEEQIAVLKKAANEMALAKRNVSDVKDDADFNKENIDQAKNKVFGAINDMIESGIESLTSQNPSASDNDDSVVSINLKDEKKKIGTKLNKLRKWQFDKFEEEFSAEIYVDSYHEYKYTKTLEELCDQLNVAIGSLGVNLGLKPDDYYVKGTEVYKIASSLYKNKMQRYDSEKQFPETGEAGIYYFARGTNDNGQWYKWTGTKYEKCNLPNEYSTGNLETIIESKLIAKGLNPKRIDIEWHNKNFDMNDDPFEY